MATPQKRKKTKKNTPKTKDSLDGMCFVIMPFGGWFDSYYSEIYSPAIVNAGLEPRRADDLYRPSNIVQDIWELTKKAKIILADLTNKNANVFYELGLAHALAKPAILITENIEDIPFDLRSLRIIEYDKNVPDWGVALQNSLKNAIKETLASPNETIPTAFLEVKRSDISTPQITRQEKDLLEVKQELEIIKRQIGSRQGGRISTLLTYSPSQKFSEVDMQASTPATLKAVRQTIRELLDGGKTSNEVIYLVTKMFNINERMASILVNGASNKGDDPSKTVA